MAPRILVVEEDETARSAYSSFLGEEGYLVSTADSYASALKHLERQPPDLLICDIFLKDHSGTELMGTIKEKGLICPVIVLTARPSLATAAEAVRIGAFDYLAKPVENSTLVKVVNLALRHKLLEEEKERYRNRLIAIFHSVKAAIFTLDSQLRVVDANHYLKSICGLAPQEVMGQVFGGGLRLCSRSCLKALRRAVNRGENIEELTIECGRRDRPDQIVVLNSSPLKELGVTRREQVVTIRDVTRLHRLEQKLDSRRPFHSMVGQSPAMQRIYRLIDDLAPTATTVLITGESGTGKELVVEALHYRSPRARGPLVKVNCAALSETLLESELFGHVKGAFTGANRSKTGRFQAANGGTIFLDEIGEIPPRVQMSLLRVIQDKRFEPVGSSTPVEVDVRIVAATNSDLEERVRQGVFREDLYYRLKVFGIHLPPLRQRNEDIPLLVRHFIQRKRRTFRKKILAISDDVLNLLMSYPWPGNVRQLEHAIEHAFVVCRGSTILLEHLPPEIQQYRPSKLEAARNERTLCREALLQALTTTGWNKAKAARLLGISRPTLYRKMAKYKIKSSPPKV